MNWQTCNHALFQAYCCQSIRVTLRPTNVPTTQLPRGKPSRLPVTLAADLVVRPLIHRLLDVLLLGSHKVGNRRERLGGDDEGRGDSRLAKGRHAVVVAALLILGVVCGQEVVPAGTADADG